MTKKLSKQQKKDKNIVISENNFESII